MKRKGTIMRVFADAKEKHPCAGPLENSKNVLHALKKMGQLDLETTIHDLGSGHEILKVRKPP